MQRRQVEVAGERIALLEAGDGPLLVLLHALGRDAEDWADVIGSLSRRFRCVAPDLPGHGQGRRHPPYTFESMADEVRGLVDALAEPYVLVTHSMGATVGWLHAMDRPPGLVGLVAEDTVPPRDGYGIPTPAPEPPEPVAYEWAARSAIIAQLNDPDPAWWPGLGDVEVPCLLLSGREDDPELTDAASVVPDCELVEVPVGHWIHQDALATYLRVVEGFLAELVC